MIHYSIYAAEGESESSSSFWGEHCTFGAAAVSGDGDHSQFADLNYLLAVLGIWLPLGLQDSVT